MKRFDDRETCFHTGKKISPPMIERRQCACCGLRIVKGYIVEIGVLSRNRRNFRHPSSSPATSASRSIILPSLWKV